MVKNSVKEVAELYLLPENIYPYTMDLSTKGRLNGKENIFRASGISIGFEDAFGFRIPHIKIYGEKNNVSIHEVLMITAEDTITSTMKMMRIISGGKRIEIRLGTNQLSSILTAFKEIIAITTKHNNKRLY